MRAATTFAAGRPDPLDPVAAPFGAYAASPRLAGLRARVIGAAGPAFLRRWLYKIFTHFTKKRGLIIDLEHLGVRRRLMIDENGQDRWVFRRGVHPEEVELRRFSDEWRGRDMVFVDIGANNGYFSAMAARWLGDKARIMAFEPHPRTFRKLTLHLEMNGAKTVEPINVALGDVDGEMILRETDAADGQNTLLPGVGPGVAIRVVPLVSALEARGIQGVDLLKIDVEGYEDRVLEPFFAVAPRSLWPRQVILEVTSRGKTWRTDVVALMMSRGYVLERQTLDNMWLALQV